MKMGCSKMMIEIPSEALYLCLGIGIGYVIGLFMNIFDGGAF